ncbi:hypothetical protein NDU88_003875 [Pleurodeles waltl]|uniref:Uncharacterized protein n=1 Tax=Pleurodeles waltl TaxID=8319 RepID=A0AAV7RGG4_PLEWA|nr:hypothetical protein NDU88_003875 [Pleurodeles waltl]
MPEERSGGPATEGCCGSRVLLRAIDCGPKRTKGWEGSDTPWHRSVWTTREVEIDQRQGMGATDLGVRVPPSGAD